MRNEPYRTYRSDDQFDYLHPPESFIILVHDRGRLSVHTVKNHDILLNLFPGEARKIRRLQRGVVGDARMT